jgi:dTDP-4-dehydrorhamnose reductase
LNFELSDARVLVTGASGRLGRVVARTFADCDVVVHTHRSLDVTDPAAVSRAVADCSPRVIVNCAAFNDVDGAETNPGDALSVNAFAVRSLGRAAETSGARLVHYSSDFVFDGAADEPYHEDDEPSPRSVYAATKLMGEWFARDAPGALVLRVESLFGAAPGASGRTSTLETMVDRLEQGLEVKAFTDRIVSPSYAADVAAATRHLLETDAPAGTYHCVNQGHSTWYDVALEAARLLGVTPRLVPITLDQVTLAAERPRYCALSARKLAGAGFEMPSWQDALARWISGRRGQGTQEGRRQTTADRRQKTGD